MIYGVGKMKKTVYKNGKLLDSFEIGANTDGKEMDIYMSNPEASIEFTSKLNENNKNKIMQLFNRKTSSIPLLSLLESHLNTNSKPSNSNNRKEEKGNEKKKKKKKEKEKKEKEKKETKGKREKKRITRKKK
tara:strand:- start:681 stop:1076 length:396 start_codon:yes stop_codon:yes gene_type:complete